MKRNYFLSIVLSLLTLCLMSCEPSSLDTKNSATEPYFPEPCLAWGSDMATVKSKMLSLGYLLVEVDSDGMGFHYSKNNNTKECYCEFSNGKYWFSQVQSRYANEAQDISMNYSKRAKYLGMYVEDDVLIEVFETKDGKTIICVECIFNKGDGLIMYFSKNSEEGKAVYEEILDLIHSSSSNN